MGDGGKICIRRAKINLYYKGSSKDFEACMRKI